ncbi:hypothetical protein LPJ81_004636 [Coemansia sp. IMI 209127]|nr:hypothetical protein LPJ81_004636 [Coemansia sp. IMI 209127]
MQIEPTAQELPDKSPPTERVSTPTKEAWILHSLKKRRAEFIHNYTLNAFIGTWNVNGQEPADAKALSRWLGFVPEDTNNMSLERLPELVVLGFQELDVRAEAFVYNNSVKDTEWTEAIERSMGDTRYSFCKIASKQLIGMFVMVYARLDVAELVSGVQAASVGCGIMGMVGNKGAVAVRLAFRDTPLCFVCSHLAHDATQVDKRNAQFHDICKRMVFGSAADADASAVDPLVPKALELIGAGHGAASRQPTIFDHSYVLWFGDLNYRLALDSGAIGDTIAQGEYASLLGLDQLRIAMLNRQAFATFEEADIAFAPTYKYVLGTTEYDAKRRPAWCDRVLWWTRPGCDGGITCTEYASVDSIATSDHKPVRALLDVDVWSVDTERRQSIYLDVLRELDRYENECIPTAALESAVVDFGDVHFGRPARQKLGLTNSGQVPIEFSFATTPSRARHAPEWLRITPSSGMLLPGVSAELEFTVMVDERTSAALNSRIMDMSDILVLHLERGRDYFVQVQGSYKPSVYGMSLDILVHCKEPVREMSRHDFERCLCSGQFSVPKCIWSLTDFLSQYAVNRGYSLFYWAGNRALARKVKESLDTAAPLDPDTILQFHLPSEEHMARTVVDDPDRIRVQDHNGQPGNGSRRLFGSVGGVIDGVGGDSGSQSGLSDQNTLVPSGMHSMLGDRSAVDAFERLSLEQSSQPQRRANAAVSASDSDSSEYGGPDEPLVAPLTAARDGNSSSNERLAGSPLPEAIANATLAAPHDVGVDTVASCLIDLLRSLPEPLVPMELYSACVEAGGISRAAALEALEDLAPENLNVLIYLLAFLRDAIEKGATSAQRVAQVFSKALLRPPLERAIDESDGERAELFLLYLLRSHGQI